MGSLALLPLPETVGRAVDAAKTAAAAAAMTTVAAAAVDAAADVDSASGSMASSISAPSAPPATTCAPPADMMAEAEEGRAPGRAGVEAHLEAVGKGVELVEAAAGGADEADHVGLVARSGGAHGGVCCWGGGGRRSWRRGCRRWCALQAAALASLRIVGVRVCVSSQVRSHV